MQTKAGVRKMLEKYGKDHYRRIGKLGGNPVLIQQGIENRRKAQVEAGKAKEDDEVLVGIP